MGSTPSALHAGSDLGQFSPAIANIQDIQSLRVQKPALLWVQMNGCHWSKVSAPIVAEFAEKSKLPVQSMDGVSNRVNLARSGLVPKGFPTIYLLQNSGKAVEFNENVTVDGLKKFVKTQLK